MKKYFIIIYLFIPFITNAQTLAGVVPSNVSQLILNDSIYVANVGEVDSIDIDLDCDSLGDLRFYLIAGFPGLDAAHHITVKSFDNNIQMCLRDSAVPLTLARTKWLTQNDTIQCTSANYTHRNIHASSSNTVLLVDWGGLWSAGPASLQDAYLGYEKFGHIGWIRISYDLSDSSTIYFKIHSYTNHCELFNLSFNNYSQRNLFMLYPNLFSNFINIKSIENNFKIDVLNQLGQSVLNREYSNSGQHSINLSSLRSGHYFVKYESAKGSHVIRIQKN